MLASILIATFNRDNLLEQNLKSLSIQNLNKKEIEVIVLNDGLESIITKNLVNKYSNNLNIKYIFTGKRNTKERSIWRNPGFVYNYGARIASGKYLFICGAEIYHQNNTIKLMLDEIESNNNLMVIPSGQDDTTGIFTDKLFKNINPALIKLDSLNTYIPFLMCILKNKFFEINGYDEDMIGIGYDDNDLIDRLGKVGLIHKLCNAKIVHLYHKRTPSHYLSGVNNIKNEVIKLKINNNIILEEERKKKKLQDELLLYNQNIFNSKRNTLDPVRNINKMWGNNNTWFLKNIPKRINFYWGEKNYHLSYIRYLSLLSARLKNPDFEIILHTPEFPSNNEVTWNTGEQQSIEHTGKNWFSEIEKLNIRIVKHNFDNCGFSNLEHEVHKSDFLRWIILFEYGGFWSDIDIIYSKSMYDASFNVPENYDINTGIHIYPKINMHAIGFLFSSIDNSLFKECHYIAARKFLEKSNTGYQSLGSIILNENFPTINSITSKYKNLKVLNIDTNVVYSVGPNDIPSLYEENISINKNNSIGIHWFGGHPLAKNFEASLTDQNLNNFKNSLSNYITGFLNDKNNNNSI